ncbi:MAG: 2-C-methyl-D-erythritol 4-phosphate cytidylyltransferase [Thermomicrobiales bacterium]|nr:2-C-methyl-D-erythritol 4-phosphate cytidylyltransferase [Thermomicrobiales bacterium]
MSNSTSAIIVAAGSGVRFGSAGKVFSPLAGRPMVAWSLDALSASAAVAEIILVAGEHTLDQANALLASGHWPKLRAVVPGGLLRQDSVRLGMQAANPDIPLLAIHDAARPLITTSDIDRCIQQAAETGAAILGSPVADTLKQTDAGRAITATIPRDGVWAAQTPQVFRRDLLTAAFDRAAEQGWTVTDDASMLELAGEAVVMVRSIAENFKITTQEDVQLASQILANRSGSDRLIARTGLGYDVHRFVAGRPLMLGGVAIPSEMGLDGHSDADVLLHAITDALLGSAALGDIGQHFPPGDDRWKNADSLIFLAQANAMLTGLGGYVVNVDATIVAEAPKIMPHAAAIRESIASALGLHINAVNVKATTNEGMGFIGRAEGMAALATVTSMAPSQ